MECFRIDESGYTGFDLLNPDQPFQGAAAVGISDDDAARLVREHFPKLRSTELKYRALARRAANHPRILALLRDLLGGCKGVSYVCDKRFLLILMFCDYAVEPWYYARGHNFYEDGQNYAMASLLAIAGPTLLGKDAFGALLRSFQHAVKDKSPASLRELVARARATDWRQLPEALGPLAQDAAPECLDAIATPAVSTDAAMVVLQALISRLEVMSDGEYVIEHDQSKNLATYHDHLQSLIDHDNAAEFRPTQITSLKFPLKLTKVVQVDSASTPAVQLADVLIGATLDAAQALAGKRPGVLDPQAVLSLYRDDQLIHLLPNIDFEREKEFRRGSQAAQMIDYFAANFARSRNR